MERYTHEGTAKTPKIDFDMNKGTLEIKGWSVPDNAIEFYFPLMDAVDSYAVAAKPATNVVIELEYFNTSSSRSILELFKKLEKIKQGGSAVTVNWHYEKDDEDMLQAAEDYKTVIDLHFNVVPINS